MPPTPIVPPIRLNAGEVLYVVFYSDNSTTSTSARFTAASQDNRYTLLYAPAARPSAVPSPYADVYVKASSQPNQQHGVVAIDEDGDTLAVGAPKHTPDPADGATINAGQVRVFRYADEAWGQLGDDIDGASSPAAMHLSGMIFALDLDAASLARREGDAHPTAEDPTADPTIARWAVGDCALHVRKDRSLGVACVVSASVSALDDEIPGRVADALLSAFTRTRRCFSCNVATCSSSGSTSCVRRLEKSTST